MRYLENYIFGAVSGLILSVQSNQFVQSKMQFVKSKMRNCAVQKHKAEDIIVQFSKSISLSYNVQTLKCCQLQGASPPDPLTRGSTPGPRWRLYPQTPVIGSALAINDSTCAVQNFP